MSELTMGLAVIRVLPNAKSTSYEVGGELDHEDEQCVKSWAGIGQC